MKKIFIFLTCVILLGLSACQKSFLQVPSTNGTINLETVYSNSVNATSALMTCYRNTMGIGWAGQNGIDAACLGMIAGERGKGYNFHQAFNMIATGLTSTSTTALNYGLLYSDIRQVALVSENIGKVPDMDAATKGYVKAEAKGLMAYIYLWLFKSYGAVPLVSHSFLPTDNLVVPRSTLQQTLDFTIKLCDDAIAGLPDSWPAAQTGRLTKGAVMAMKAQVLLFAARPLFNSAAPYKNLPGNNALISFGNADPSRWNAVATASQTALTWANAHGYYILNSGGGVNIPNTNAFDDYGTATSTPANAEIILADHLDNPTTFSNNDTYYNNSAYWTVARYNGQLTGMLGNFLPNYYKADGTDQSWPQPGDPAPRPATDYVTRFSQMEPRFKADWTGPGIDAANNKGDFKWSASGWGQLLSNIGNPPFSFPNVASYGYGCAVSTKFYYHAGSRLWFEYPLFRVAELYLNLAEAYNELGQTALALQNLNVVHNRAGLPSITETDKVKLRAIIQREWAVEFYNENKRYYDVKHWKLPNIGTNIIGGPVYEFQFASNSGSNKNLITSLVNYWSAVEYTAYWDDRMFLEPFPQAEVNKQVVIQNPGY